MGKVKKFAPFSIRKITGGKDPVRLVGDFIAKLGSDPDECVKEKDAAKVRWMLTVADGRELEVLAEGLNTPGETTIYMGVNIATVPVRGAYDMLAASLEIADGLIGIKVSLVGHYIVLSASLGAAGLSLDELDYQYRLIAAQQNWFREALLEELGWEDFPHG